MTYAVKINTQRFICPVYYLANPGGIGGACVVDSDLATTYSTLEEAESAAAYVRHGIDIDPESVSVSVVELD